MTKASKKNEQTDKTAATPAAAKARLAATGRNEPCPCGSAKKYKKCHMPTDDAAAAPPVVAPSPQVMVANGWRLFEQRRPGAAEKEFRAALAISPNFPEALVGVGMARLSAGDNDGARKELEAVVKASEPVATALAKDGAKDGFSRPEAQPYLRACHALGCLAYDQERYADALVDLEHVYSVDEGTVGTEARLIAGKTLAKLGRHGDAVPILEIATKSEAAASRAQMGLVLSHFGAGNAKAANNALTKALAANPYFAKALLGQLRKRTDQLTGAAPGSREEATIYAQTYGDVWNDDAKKFLGAALGERETVAAP